MLARDRERGETEREREREREREEHVGQTTRKETRGIGLVVYL